jgi:hypothetical protein
MKLSTTLLIFLLLTSCLTSLGQSSLCKETVLGSISFKEKSSKLTTIAKKQFDILAKIIKNSNDSCQLIATASYTDLCDRCGALAWYRTQAILYYLARKGITKEKMVSNSRLGGNNDLINLTLAQMTEQKHIHPNFRPN